MREQAFDPFPLASSLNREREAEGYRRTENTHGGSARVPCNSPQSQGVNSQIS